VLEIKPPAAELRLWQLIQFVSAQRLGLTDETWAVSAELRQFRELNKNRCNIPERLLKKVANLR
jgi:hypothetical protein